MPNVTSFGSIPINTIVIEAITQIMNASDSVERKNDGNNGFCDMLLIRM